MAGIAVGIDFGTTNSSIARRIGDSTAVELLRVPLFGVATEAYRSLLYLEQIREQNKSRLASWTGPEGIEHYLARETGGRLIQSLKSFLSSRSLQSTEIFGRRVTIEDLIARILGECVDPSAGFCCVRRAILACSAGLATRGRLPLCRGPSPARPYCSNRRFHREMAGAVVCSEVMIRL